MDRCSRLLREGAAVVALLHGGSVVAVMFRGEGVMSHPLKTTQPTAASCAAVADVVAVSVGTVAIGPVVYAAAAGRRATVDSGGGGRGGGGGSLRHLTLSTV
ncbi:hypothetical protein PLESTB_001182100 [Pleodorina starrii]|uniref:Uncharacterized protein n=1 Tax=Pleodorina starrii TaxID=330485 RepID=A0A9W6F5K1_9CHLO|nr:hypothetical protein PLESTM_000258100 [Pleodorina starrii]GLC57089.1 hypothetical protein PLESTB_001182100 [Pleodorina starrii]GLC64925.1 hypothetical protein PLESTF_000222500 [Pleodorina starrii]